MFEIGAYNANWGQIHLGPEGAIAAFEMMDAALVAPIHWGTFDLGMHGWRDPIRSFAKAAEAAGHRWAAPVPGGTIEPGVSEPREPWCD
jgi:L-ascorbate metabolism protein UlaG (beta-lactamase superfamily)